MPLFFLILKCRNHTCDDHNPTEQVPILESAKVSESETLKSKEVPKTRLPFSPRENPESTATTASRFLIDEYENSKSSFRRARTRCFTVKLDETDINCYENKNRSAADPLPIETPLDLQLVQVADKIIPDIKHKINESLSTPKSPKQEWKVDNPDVSFPALKQDSNPEAINQTENRIGINEVTRTELQQNARLKNDILKVIQDASNVNTKYVSSTNSTGLTSIKSLQPCDEESRAFHPDKPKEVQGDKNVLNFEKQVTSQDNKPLLKNNCTAKVTNDSRNEYVKSNVPAKTFLVSEVQIAPIAQPLEAFETNSTYVVQQIPEIVITHQNPTSVFPIPSKHASSFRFDLPIPNNNNNKNQMQELSLSPSLKLPLTSKPVTQSPVVNFAQSVTIFTSSMPNIPTGTAESEETVTTAADTESTVSSSSGGSSGYAADDERSLGSSNENTSVSSSQTLTTIESSSTNFP